MAENDPRHVERENPAISRRAIENESQRNKPNPRRSLDKNVKFGLDVIVARKPESALYISHFLPHGKLEHFYCDRRKIMPLKEILDANGKSYDPPRFPPEAEGQYRSSHMRLYKLVTGHYPDRHSYDTWFGWSKMFNETQWYSCALNTKDGWNGAGDQAKKKNVSDIFRHECLCRLLHAFADKIDEHKKAGNERMRKTWDEKRTDLEHSWHVLTRHGKGGTPEDTHMLIELKKCGKMGIKFDPSEDLGWSYRRCLFFKCAEKGKPRDLPALFNAIDEGIDMGDVPRKTAFMHAAKKGRLDNMEVLHKLGASPNRTDNSGWSAQFYAAKDRNFKVLKWLYDRRGRHPDKQVDVNQKDHDSLTVAMHACIDGDVDVLKYCIAAEANLNTTEKSREATALNFALEGKTPGHRECAALLREHKFKATEDWQMQRRIEENQRRERERQERRNARRRFRPGRY